MGFTSTRHHHLEDLPGARPFFERTDFDWVLESAGVAVLLLGVIVTVLT
jgi:hypothetical protein